MAGVIKIKLTVPRQLLDQRGGLKKKFIRFVSDVTEVATERIRSQIAKDAPLGASGIMGNSFTTGAPKIRGNRVEGRINAIGYTRFVEEGHGGGGRFPPEGPIRQWLRRVKGLKGAELKKATFLVRRKIARIGVKGKFFIKKAIAASRRNVERLYTNAFKRFK